MAALRKKRGLFHFAPPAPGPARCARYVSLGKLSPDRSATRPTTRPGTRFSGF
jgi:hypothetical protein